MVNKKRLIVIDSNSLIHRAYHALPPLTTKKGELVNAVYGFLLVFLKVIREFQPDFIAAAFDFPAPTFRHKQYEAYKAKRPPVPKDLSQQLPKIKKILKSFNVPVFEKKGFEADDIIGTITNLAPKKQAIPEIETIVLSGDLDILQLVDSHTIAYTLRRGVKDALLYDIRAVKEKYQGLTPDQLPEFKALKGDPSDNIPGLPGIGEKIAIGLIKEFGNLESLYRNLEGKTERAKKIKPKIKNILLRFKDQAFFNRQLSQIKKDAPIDFNLKKCEWKDYNKEKVIHDLEELDFSSLITRLPSLREEKDKKQKKEGVRISAEKKTGQNLRLW